MKIEASGGFAMAKSTRRSMLGISHYKARQRILAKAMADPDHRKDILITTEEFTTKQCPFCPYLYHDIGGSKTLRCGGCGFVGERTMLVALNILVRSLTKGELKMGC
jgi:transposase